MEFIVIVAGLCLIAIVLGTLITNIRISRMHSLAMADVLIAMCYVSAAGLFLTSALLLGVSFFSIQPDDVILANHVVSMSEIWSQPGYKLCVSLVLIGSLLTIVAISKIFRARLERIIVEFNHIKTGK